ncbi:ricin-type beta-trefoil lectin domain protein [Streptomyces sp. NPDC057837]|uniref:ricin-type beta-trefoil lectin domain protein n=1 Tax=Streptomyces sp. NPDC057837 TaxID=3346260 RepID=UPI0036B0E7D4
MARADDRGHGGARPGHGIHAGASDARLTELLRADTATAYPALQELRVRHHPHVLAYARLCAPSESMARQLAAQAFMLAARQTARGIDSGLPWRHELLLLVARSAGSWAEDGRAACLDAALLLVLNTAGPSGPQPPMLPAFRSLPPRAQGLIWYGIVEREPAPSTAALLGLSREDVTYGTDPALHQLARACLRARLAASEDPDCPDFGRLIEESTRPDSPRESADLQAHMARCPQCTTAHAELSALRDAPHTALAEGLLPWGGTAYAAGRADHSGHAGHADNADHAGRPRRAGRADHVGQASHAGQGGDAGRAGDARHADGRGDADDLGGRTAGGSSGRRMRSFLAQPGRALEEPGGAPDRRRTVLVSAVLGAALLPLAVFLMVQSGAPPGDRVGPEGVRTSVPPVAVTVTATVAATPSTAAPSPSRSSSPSASRSAKPPSPTRRPSPTRTAGPKPPPVVATRPPSDAFAQVVNARSGLCLDVAGAYADGTDVITAPCSSSPTQRWRVDDHRRVLQSAADPDFCLDSRGATHRGVGIWSCDSVEGRNGRNLMFFVGEDGLIRPAIAYGTAVTADGGAGDGLSLESADGGARQRWRAGAA